MTSPLWIMLTVAASILSASFDPAVSIDCHDVPIVTLYQPKKNKHIGQGRSRSHILQTLGQGRWTLYHMLFSLYHDMRIIMCNTLLSRRRHDQ